MTFSRYILFTFAFLISSQLLQAQTTVTKTEPIKKVKPALPKKNQMYDPNKFLLVVTPIYGGLKSEIEFGYRFPFFQGGGLNLNNFYMLQGKQTLQGNGYGGGLEASLIKGNWSFVSVNFKYQDTPYNTQASLPLSPQDNGSTLTGSLNYVQYAFKNRTRFTPFIGGGFFNGFVDTRIKDFVAYEPGNNSLIYVNQVQATNHVVNPFPKLGVKIKVPIQHWYIAPFYSYFYEEVTNNISYAPGRVLTPDFNLSNQALLFDAVRSGDAGNLLYPGNVRVRKIYHQNIVGLNFFLDFHYFIQFRAKIYRNLTRGLWTSRAFLTFLFHKNLGVTAYYEYAERITGRYRYWLIGPSFVTQF